MGFILREKDDGSFYIGKTYTFQGELYAALGDFKHAKRYRSEKILKKICHRLNAICVNQLEIVKEKI